MGNLDTNGSVVQNQSSQPMPTEVTEIMEPRKNSKLNILIVILIILLLLCCIGSALGYFLMKDSIQTFLNDTQKIQNDINGKSKIISETEKVPELTSQESEEITIDSNKYGLNNTDAYKFYFPARYTKSTITGVLEYYQANELNSIGTFNSIVLSATPTGATKTSKATKADCVSFVESLSFGYAEQFGIDKANVKFTNSDIITKPGVLGCEVDAEITLLGGIAYVQNNFIYKDSGTQMYVVSTLSDSLTNAEALELHTAKDLFLLK